MNGRHDCMLQFVARIAVGPRPAHIYAITERGELWSHSDAEGIFYVIPLQKPYSSMASTPLAVGTH